MIIRVIVGGAGVVTYEGMTHEAISDMLTAQGVLHEFVSEDTYAQHLYKHDMENPRLLKESHENGEKLDLLPMADAIAAVKADSELAKGIFDLGAALEIRDAIDESVSK